MKKLPYITAVIPCVNEEFYIKKCINSILRSAYPVSKIIILVVDGLSTDKTVQIVKEIQQNKKCNLKLFYNKKRSLAAAWNIGIQNASGKYLFAMNAHASIKMNYFTKIVRCLEETGVSCCGACLTTVPQSDDYFGKIIGKILSSKIGVGNSKFRTGIKKQEYVDSAHMAGYRIGVIKNMRFNEHLLRSQDIEFNTRLRRSGQKIMLLPDKLIKYYTRSDIRKFPKDMFINGYWVTQPIYSGCFIAKARHLVPLIFVGTLIFSGIGGIFSKISIGIFLGILVIYSAFVVNALLSNNKKSEMKQLFVQALLLFVLHICYGTGSLFGLFPKTRFKTK